MHSLIIKTVKDYTYAMEYIAIGLLADDAMLIKRKAESLDGNKGGWPEYLFASEEDVKRYIIFRTDLPTTDWE